jgi:hypothetical protein
MPPTSDIFQRAALPFPRSLPEFQKLFPDDAACAAYLERIRWDAGFACQYCGVVGEPYRFTNRPGVLRCRECLKDIGLTAGTVMERTHTPLSIWFWGAYLIASMTPDILRKPLPFLHTVHDWQESRPVKPDARDVLICLGLDVLTALDLPHSDGAALDYTTSEFGIKKPSEALATLHALRATADKMQQFAYGANVTLAEFAEACRELDQ